MTLPQEPSAAPGSDPSAPFGTAATAPADIPDDLICLAAAIFDRAAISHTLNAAAATARDETELRSAAVGVLSDARKNGFAAIEAGLHADPFAARPAIRAYSWLTDSLIISVFDLVTTHIHPPPDPTASEHLSLLAVGGYGRGEMAPQSDIDLLFLTPRKITPWAENVIESMLYILWDLRLKVGHASRTIKDCLRLGRDDYTIRTALLEHRHITGDTPLATRLNQSLRKDLFKGTERDFIEAKLAERETRHAKQGERYVVEPNVKEGKGGLRDLQSLFWIAKYIHDVRNARDLVRLKVFSEDEFRTFDKAETFLWAVRCHIHLITGRPNDQLTFDLQVQVADRMGYADKGGRRAVEHFMQDYYRQATRVGDLTRIFLTKLEAAHAKAEPLLERLFKRRRKLKPGYLQIHGRLAIEDEKAFLSDPLNLLRLFEEGLRTGMLIHPDAMRLVTANLDMIDDEMRENREANRIFLDLLLKHGNPERALRRMNELGVLAAFIPEFEPIVAMMQFNMYHAYTVDEHTIQVISNFNAIEQGELDDELPVSADILKRKRLNRKVLMVAMLCHDIGKGRDVDHSILGAQIARRVAPRLGLKPKEVDTVEWLVRYHLLMSDMAQKRDIADPRTVRDFAKAVGSVARLDLLLLLTVCDIRGVGPKTWNNWKAVLLRALYRQTRLALEEGIEALSREVRGTEAKKNLRAALPDWDAADLKIETARHYDPYWQGLHVTAHVVFARLLKGIEDDEIRIDLHPDDDRDATRACFAMADHPGIFSRMCGALALVGANIVDARTFTTKDGYATAAFWIQDSAGHPFEAGKLKRIEGMIHKTLKGEIIAADAIADRDKFKTREKAFRVPTSITFDNDGSEIYTIIEVDTRDRSGLLFDLTRTMANANIYIASAVIATYGEQVVDSFYVKDMFGLKLHSKAKQRALEKRLREAIETGVERARRP
ncbi:[protein-PII] uridylyltransferase [Aquicoccus porphyridii]|uniref:Bifunctional uridylyltransferase/uridylyl-removing enzyme n=1 Tax=Aquicoccus porphyridii TaxID=1852029 RepID=A0A5A9YYD8_9RHOB|nr:[protein-PII] uridylyltransferase [Aquicoccus porphyridii]KAA0909874.1 [protein-PII] uridylyltransferase [Aquicoccus porphyridii]RAI53215.1 [protein-PII] uridylyltransferase [Rhodobacteraceae bacterium AsT-22]